MAEKKKPAKKKEVKPEGQAHIDAAAKDRKACEKASK